jgi:serine/threonine-protein kinase
VDPGKHVVRAEAPGKRPFERSVDVPSANAARESVEIPRLEDVPAVERPVPIGARPVPPTTGAVAPVESVTKSGSNSPATIGWVVGAVGVASVGVGSYFGLRAINRWSDRNQQCTAGCTPGAKDAGDDANQAATIADIGLGAGLAALAAGTFLVVSGHSAKASAPGETAAVRVAPVALNRGAGLWVQGDW